MSVDPKPSSAKQGKQSIPPAAAVGLLAVALVALFFTVIKPTFFSGEVTPPTPSPGVNTPSASQMPLPGQPGGPPLPVGAPPPGANTQPSAQPNAAAPPPPMAPPSADVPKTTSPSRPPQSVNDGKGVPSTTMGVSRSPVSGGKLKPLPNEIVVSGNITSVKAGQYKMKVARVELPGKPPIVISPPRNKVIVLDKQTRFTKNRAVTAKTNVKTNASVSVVGPNLGKGAPLVAREVAL